MAVSIGQIIQVQSYKHDESLHRIWDKATVIDHSDGHIVCANERTKVIESNGRFWYTKEPSVTWFFKDYWFNIIGILRPNGVYYYCNIASPYVIDDEALKYIDYDLDIKVNPDHSFVVLDRKEYSRHQSSMDYPEELKAILEAQILCLKDMIRNQQGPFTGGVVTQLYERFTLMGAK